MYPGIMANMTSFGTWVAQGILIYCCEYTITVEHVLITTLTLASKNERKRTKIPICTVYYSHNVTENDYCTSILQAAEERTHLQSLLYCSH